MLLWQSLPSLWLSLAFARRGWKATSLSILHLHSSTPGPPTSNLSPQWSKSDTCAVPRNNRSGDRSAVCHPLFLLHFVQDVGVWWGGRRALWGFIGCFRGFRATTSSSGFGAVCGHLPAVMSAVPWQGLLPENRAEGWLSREKSDPFCERKHTEGGCWHTFSLPAGSASPGNLLSQQPT